MVEIPWVHTNSYMVTGVLRCLFRPSMVDALSVSTTGSTLLWPDSETISGFELITATRHSLDSAHPRNLQITARSFARSFTTHYIVYHPYCLFRQGRTPASSVLESRSLGNRLLSGISVLLKEIYCIDHATVGRSCSKGTRAKDNAIPLPSGQFLRDYQKTSQMCTWEWLGPCAA